MAKKIKIAEIGELSPWQMKRIELEDGDQEVVALINLDGQYYAISNTCSHEDASLSAGKILAGVVECPRHGPVSISKAAPLYLCRQSGPSKLIR